jgi:penicillin-binding protein 1C
VSRRTWPLLLVGLLLAAGLGWIWLQGYGERLPSFEAVRAAWRPSDAWLLDRRGDPVQAWRVDMSARREPWLTLQRCSPALVRALLSAEDRRFYTHAGVDWRALGAAVWDALRGQPARGASTLTMQLAAQLDPALRRTGHRRTPLEKLTQIRAGLALERHWSKSQILEAYLNLTGFRGELRGASATSYGLFGKDPSGLTEAESVVLAAILPSPNADPERIGQRACRIVRNLAKRPILGARPGPVPPLPRGEGRGEGIKDRVGADCAALQALAAEVLTRPPLVVPRPDWAPQLAARLLRRPGERVATTLDSRIQRFATESLRRHLVELDGHNVRDGAVLAVDNRSGDILAYVASAGASSTAHWVDGVQALRQAGSTLKPFLYSLGVERRQITAASVLDDSPVKLETGNGLYIPQNYDRDFKGLVSVRRALASSLNVPAVRTLVLLGVEAFRDRLRDLGYTSLTEDGAYYGYSLALGSAEVSLAAQVNAYRTLANGGVWSPLRLRPQEPREGGRRVVSAPASWIVADILADPAARSTTFGLDNPLRPSFWAAVKTGTSKDMRDNWCIGFSHRYTVGIWVGNFEGDPMQNVSGMSGAAPAWLEIMDALHASGAEAASAPPPGVVRTSLRYDPPIEPPRSEWFVTGTETKVVRLIDPREGAPHIEAPANGTIIALDPDIPPDKQRVLFRASGPKGAHWTLDTLPVGSAARPHPWVPRPGAHTLALVEGDRALDQIRFQVRAPAR